MRAYNADRRNRKRRTLTLYMRFVNSRTGEPVGNLADLSPGGFMLESVKTIPVNAEFSFRVDLPPEAARKPFMVFTARSRWSRRDPVDGRLYDTGFEIMQMDPGDAQILQTILDRYGRNSTFGD